MLQNGRGQIRELHEPRLPGRARLERSASEVRSSDGNHAQPFGGAGVGQAGEDDVGPRRGDLEYGGNPGINGGGLLGTTGRWSHLILGIHIGGIADRPDVDQRQRACAQSRRRNRLVVLLVTSHRPAGAGRAQRGARADCLDASAVSGDLVAEQAKRGIEHAATGGGPVLTPVGHHCGAHLRWQRPARGLDVRRPATATAHAECIAGALACRERQPSLHRTGVGVNRADRQRGGCSVPQQRPKRRCALR